MTAPTSRNRLAVEDGPYLRRLADDPINWQPWDELALTAAVDRDLPIFLSIGHATSPWCYRMWTESFRDEEVADLLNERFVPIAVDRDVRPALDSIYRTVCRVVENESGWPLSVWLTPECEPFYVGTYFPPENEDWAPGFAHVLELVAQKWSSPEVREAVEKRGEKWASYAREELESLPEPANGVTVTGDATLERVADIAVRTADREYGGWGTEGKFLESSRIRLLLSIDVGTANNTSVATAALDGIVDGAVCDQIGGGFFGAARSRDWTDPQSGKRLGVNADVVRALLAGYEVTGDRRYATVVRQALASLDRDLADPRGGFRAAIAGPDWPADGERTGGRAYYGWTQEEIESVLDESDAALACERYGIDEEVGSMIPSIAVSVADLADERDESEAILEARLDRIRDELLAARSERDQPPRDDRVVAGPNGLAVWALADAGFVLEETYARRAADALSSVRERLWTGDRLKGRFIEGAAHPRADACLQDYAYLGRGAFACYGATGDVGALRFALDVADVIRVEFFDEEDGRFRHRPDQDDTLIASPQETRDWEVPAAIAVATDLLSIADRFVAGDRFGELAVRVVDGYGGRILTDLLRHHSFTLAKSRVESGWTEVVVSTDAVPNCWSSLESEQSRYDMLLAPCPPTEAGLTEWLAYLDVDEVPPVWAGREISDEPRVHKYGG